MRIETCCTHPLKAFPIGLTSNGKTDYKICSYDVDHVEFRDNKVIACNFKERSLFASAVVRDFIEIPCGKCIGCRLRHAAEWADRCMLEMRYHKSSYFVTLTYDDEHLPVRQYLLEDTGEVGDIGTLVKRDFQLFMKSLRKAYVKKAFENGYETDKLRFFASGEYGDESYRPHYHAIIFGLELDDLTFYKTSTDENGQVLMYYNSPWLSGIWKKGHVVVAKACWETCAYVAKYIMKKQSGKNADIYKELNHEPPFVLMSRKPGIGRDFYDESGYRFFEEDYVSIGTADGSRRIYVPKYFQRLEAEKDEAFMQSWKEQRMSNAEFLQMAKDRRTSLSYEERLKKSEDRMQRVLQRAKRKEV